MSANHGNEIDHGDHSSPRHGHRGARLPRPPRPGHGDAAGREGRADHRGSAAQRGHWPITGGVALPGRRRPRGGVRHGGCWANPEYKARLLSDPEAVLADMGYELPDPTPKLGVVENSDDVHHLVVCTLCSCYPRALLGRPPDWYKSFAYRSRAVVDPRGVLREFGTEVSEDTEVVVLDSTADLRYLVLPQQPAGTEGMNEEELAALVTRDSMIGVSRALAPELVAADD